VKRGLVGALAVAVVAIAGCSSGGSATKSTADKQSPSTTQLARQADLQPCPAKGQPATGGKVLPDLTLSCLGGSGSVSLRHLTGTPTILNFWATWCTDCVQEMSALQRFATAAGSKVRVLGVNTQDASQEAPLSLLAHAKIHFASLYDQQGKATRALGLPGLPVTVLVRPDGSVADRQIGPVTFDQLRTLSRQHLDVSVSG
jgi:thiol-disulfide isomerase/thioredoxin